MAARLETQAVPGPLVAVRAVPEGDNVPVVRDPQVQRVRGLHPFAEMAAMTIAVCGHGPAVPAHAQEGDLAYEVEVALAQVDAGAQGGLLLFFNNAPTGTVSGEASAGPST